MRSITLRIGLAAFSLLLLNAGNGVAQQRYSTGPVGQPTGISNPMRAPARRAMDTGHNAVNPVQRVPTTGATGRIAPAGFVPAHSRRQEASIAVPALQGAQEPVAQPSPQPQALAAPQNPRIVGGPDMSSCATCDSGYGLGESYFDDGYVAGDGGCATCGGWGDDCGMCCDRGGCPGGIADCWLGRLGLVLYKGEYSFGAQGFKSPAFRTDTNNEFVQDSSFGFNAGANFGVPLCNLTCGLVSGQLGVRAVSSDFSGSPFTSDNRQQLFVTAGFYRRVDNGLQFGCVADFLEESWFVDSSLVQIRGDLAWVFYGDNAMGFRFSKNVQDDVGSGRFNGQPVTNLITSSLDNYRFYYRQQGFNGGFGDCFLGWSEESHVVGGMEFDVPLTERVALQSSFTYYFPSDDQEVLVNGGNANEAWNVGVGFVYRPQGRCYYQNYDRPILPVADNGTMTLRRSR